MQEARESGGSPQPARRGRVAAGIAFTLASGLCFGTMPVLAKFAYQGGTNVPTLLLLRFSLAAACLWGLLLYKGLPVPRGRWLGLLVLLGSVGYAGQSFCFFTAITMASVGLISLLLYLYPALVAILGWAVLRHRISGLQAVAIAIALAGSALTIGRAGDGSFLGILLGMLAALTYSCYILAGSRIPASISPIAASAVIITAAAGTYAGAAAVRGVQLPVTAGGWWAVAGVAVVCTVLAVLFFFEGLERVGPVRASVYSTVEPVCTLALAATLLGESITAARVLGGVLILAAVLLLAREELRAGQAAPAPNPPGEPRRSPAAPPPTAEA